MKQQTDYDPAPDNRHRVASPKPAGERLEWRLPETTRLPRRFHSTHEIEILHQRDGPYSTQSVIHISAHEYRRVAIVKSMLSDPNIEPV